jgi:predicted nucleic acid-binding protein
MARTYGQQIVWWGTPIETISALNRLVREGYVSSKENTQSYVRLEYLRNRWNEIQPTDILREHAERLLRMHKLRAADALQLSAALTWCRNSPRKHAFIAADIALLEAAEAEGFIVISL